MHVAENFCNEAALPDAARDANAPSHEKVKAITSLKSNLPKIGTIACRRVGELVALIYGSNFVCRR